MVLLFVGVMNVLWIVLLALLAFLERISKGRAKGPRYLSSGGLDRPPIRVRLAAYFLKQASG